MHFRYSAAYFRHLLSVTYYTRLTHAATTSQLLLSSRKRIRTTCLCCCFLCLALPSRFHGNRQMVFSITTWIERKTGGDLNLKVSVLLK